MINIHKKDEWNWGLEIKVKFLCNVCELEFSTKSMLRTHVQSGHKEVNGTVVEDTSHKIIPDDEFLTKNTKDLEEMLSQIPKESLYTEEEEFYEDVQEVLNKKEDNLVSKTPGKFLCQDCKFKAGSNKAMGIHIMFLHDMNFHTCNICSMRTKTTRAMKNHTWRVHKVNTTYNTPPKGKTDAKPENLVSTDSDLESSDSDGTELPDLYEEGDWKSGHNFKSRSAAFGAATINLKSLFKKSPKEKYVGGVKLRVVATKKQGDGKLTSIELTDKEGIGQVQLQTFGPNPKTRQTTVQISKSSKGELRHVEVFVSLVVKPILDRLIKGETLKELQKSFHKSGI